MMKPKSKASSYSCLEFFKVFLPTSTSLHLCLPPAFVDHFDGTLPNKAILKDDIGKSRHVTLEKVDNRVYFTNGWQAFVDDHFLKYGDFLIFQYDGTYMFDVKMFGKNGLKKELVVGNYIPDVKIESEPRVMKEDGKLVVPYNRRHLGVESNGKSVHKSKGISTRNAPRTTRHVAREGPCFTRTMRHWSRHRLYISNSVLKRYKIVMKADIVLKDEEGKLWAATICSTTQNRFSISAGWLQFYLDHNLRVNDECEFEFVVGERNVCQQINVKVTRRSLASQSKIK